jgi:hypothetical protein
VSRGGLNEWLGGQYDREWEVEVFSRFWLLNSVTEIQAGSLISGETGKGETVSCLK